MYIYVDVRIPYYGLCIYTVNNQHIVIMFSIGCSEFDERLIACFEVYVQLVIPG